MIALIRRRPNYAKLAVASGCCPDAGAARTKAAQKAFLAAASAPGTAQDSNWSLHGNLLWNPVPQVTFGAEYSYQFASKYNGPNANIQRLQLSAIYRF